MLYVARMIIHTIGRPGRLFVVGLVIYAAVLIAGIVLLVADVGPPSRPVGLTPPSPARSPQS